MLLPTRRPSAAVAVAPRPASCARPSHRNLPLHPLALPSAAKPIAKKPKQRDRKKPRRGRANTSAKQQDAQLCTLTFDVHQLREQLQLLAKHRQLLVARAALSGFSPQPHDAILRSAAQYVQGFARDDRTQAQQCALVQALAHEQLSMGITGFGVDMLLAQWRRYISLFRVHAITLHTMELLPTSSSSIYPSEQDDHVLVKCVTTFHGVFTRDAVNAVFPSAQCELSLLLRVLGAKLELPLVLHLYFSTSGQLMRHDGDADFLGAAYSALDGDMQAAVRFMDHARVGAESTLPIERVSVQKTHQSSVVTKRFASCREDEDEGEDEEEEEEEEEDEEEDEEEEEEEEEGYKEGAQSPRSPSTWTNALAFDLDELLPGEDDHRAVVLDDDHDDHEDSAGMKDDTIRLRKEEEKTAVAPSRHSLSFLLSS